MYVLASIRHIASIYRRCACMQIGLGLEQTRAGIIKARSTYSVGSTGMKPAGI